MKIEAKNKMDDHMLLIARTSDRVVGLIEEMGNVLALSGAADDVSCLTLKDFIHMRNMAYDRIALLRKSPCLSGIGDSISMPECQEWLKGTSWYKRLEVIQQFFPRG